MSFTDRTTQDALQRLQGNTDFEVYRQALESWRAELVNQLLYANDSDRAMLMVGLARSVDILIKQIKGNT